MQKQSLNFSRPNYSTLIVWANNIEKTYVFGNTLRAISRIVKNDNLLYEVQFRVNKKDELKKYLLGHIEYIDKKPYLISEHDRSILYVCQYFQERFIKPRNENFVYLVPKNKIK